MFFNQSIGLRNVLARMCFPDIDRDEFDSISELLMEPFQRRHRARRHRARQRTQDHEERALSNEVGFRI